MNKEEIIDFMIKSVMEDVRKSYEHANVPANEIEEIMNKSSEMMVFLMINLFNKMKASNIISL